VLNSENGHGFYAEKNYFASEILQHKYVLIKNKKKAFALELR
jgi:hypothetical protein